MSYYVIVSRYPLKILKFYESDRLGANWIPSHAEPIAAHIEIADDVDRSCLVITGSHLDENDVIVPELGLDPDRVAAKALNNKNSRIADLNTQTWSTIMAEAQSIYGSSDPILVLASHSTFEDMVSRPAAYVGDMFADTTAVLAYAEPLLTASSAFGKWRLGVLAAEQVAKAAILAE